MLLCGKLGFVFSLFLGSLGCIQELKGEEWDLELPRSSYYLGSKFYPLHFSREWAPWHLTGLGFFSRKVRPVSAVDAFQGELPSKASLERQEAWLGLCYAYYVPMAFLKESQLHWGLHLKLWGAATCGELARLWEWEPFSFRLPSLGLGCYLQVSRKMLLSFWGECLWGMDYLACGKVSNRFYFVKSALDPSLGLQFLYFLPQGFVLGLDVFRGLQKEPSFPWRGGVFLARSYA